MLPPTTKLEPLACYTELMNELLPVSPEISFTEYSNTVYEQVCGGIEGNETPSAEARQKLLYDVRSVCDVYVEDCTKAENLLLAAQQTDCSFINDSAPRCQQEINKH